MKLTAQDLKTFAQAQSRAWGGYVIWKTYHNADGFIDLFEFIVFLIAVEVLWRKITGIFPKGKTQ